jgi:hypothetical protein
VRGDWATGGREGAHDVSVLVQDVRNYLADPEVDWVVERFEWPAGVDCAVCSGPMSVGESARVGVPGGELFPVHQECHEARSGLGPEALMMSVKLGCGRLLRMARDREGLTWLRDFVEKEGHELGRYVVGYGVPWWDARRGVDGVDELIRLVRFTYLYEREAPKFEALGGQLPAWDESQPWSEYLSKGRGSLPKGPFYTVLDRLPRPERGFEPDREATLKRTNHRCGICGGALFVAGQQLLPIQMDHIRPFIRGGVDAAPNFHATHYFCNQTKKDIMGGHAPLGIRLGRFILGGIADGVHGGLRDWLCVNRPTAD